MPRLLVAFLVLLMSTSVSSAQGIGGRLFSTMDGWNQPLAQSTPGLPVASPMYLVAPRISGGLSYQSSGGLANPEGRRILVGILFPRIGNGLGVVQNPPATGTGFFQSGLAIVFPRVSVASQIVLNPAPGIAGAGAGPFMTSMVGTP